MIPGVADKKNLQPMYDNLNAYIRAVDADHIIMFESVTWDDFIPVGASLSSVAMAACGQRSHAGCERHTPRPCQALITPLAEVRSRIAVLCLVRLDVCVCMAVDVCGHTPLALGPAQITTTTRPTSMLRCSFHRGSKTFAAFTSAAC